MHIPFIKHTTGIQFYRALYFATGSEDVPEPRHFKMCVHIGKYLRNTWQELLGTYMTQITVFTDFYSTCYCKSYPTENETFSFPFTTTQGYCSTTTSFQQASEVAYCNSNTTVCSSNYDNSQDIQTRCCSCLSYVYNPSPPLPPPQKKTAAQSSESYVQYREGHTEENTLNLWCHFT
jgi:hypothetical protein